MIFNELRQTTWMSFETSFDGPGPPPALLQTQGAWGTAPHAPFRLRQQLSQNRSRALVHGQLEIQFHTVFRTIAPAPRELESVRRGPYGFDRELGHTHVVIDRILWDHGPLPLFDRGVR
jgi:hypothetical protein